MSNDQAWFDETAEVPARAWTLIGIDFGPDADRMSGAVAVKFRSEEAAQRLLVQGVLNGGRRTTNYGGRNVGKSHLNNVLKQAREERERAEAMKSAGLTYTKAQPSTLLLNLLERVAA